MTYLQLGRLVFAFSQEDSSTARIMREGSLGPVVSALSPEMVAQKLEDLFTWDLSAAEEGWRNLIEYRFNEQRIMADLQAVLAR